MTDDYINMYWLVLVTTSLWLLTVCFWLLAGDCYWILAANVCCLCECWLHAAVWWLPVADYGLLTPSCQLLAIGCWVHTRNGFSSGFVGLVMLSVGLHLFIHAKNLDPCFRWVEILLWFRDTRSDSISGWGCAAPSFGLCTRPPEFTHFCVTIKIVHFTDSRTSCVRLLIIGGSKWILTKYMPICPKDLVTVVLS